jgi:hypothetical protein
MTTQAAVQSNMVYLPRLKASPSACSPARQINANRCYAAILQIII